MPAWPDALTESGVIHRAFGSRLDSKLAMGPDPGLPLRDWFGTGTSDPLIEIMQHTAVYDATAGKTFVAWLGPILRPYITYYDHTAGEWGPIVQVSTVALSNDDHGAPSLCQDASGYLHIFHSTHNNAAEYAISTSPRDISAWTVQTDVAGVWTYQQPFVIAGNIYLFGREQAVANTYTISFKKSNGVASGHTWNSLVTLFNFTDDMMYPSSYVVRGDDVHMAFWNRLGVGLDSEHIYYAVYETDTGLLKNAAGTSVAYPVSLATANTDFRVFDSGTDQANACSLWFDSGGAPHIAFVHDVAGAGSLKHTRWNGTAWTTPVTLSTSIGLWNNPAPIIASDTSGTLYWANAGEIKKAVWNPSDDTGITVSTFLTQWGNLSLRSPIAVPNAHADLRLLVDEQENDAWNYEHVRIGAWGDSGWLQADATRMDHAILFPLNDASGATTLEDRSNHRQVFTKGTLVSGVAGPLGLTGLELASGREGTVAHTANQWLFGGHPCTIRFIGKDLSGGIFGKGRPASNTLRYGIALHASLMNIRINVKPGASFITAFSSTVASWAGVHLYEIVWDGVNTFTFRRDGAALGTSTAIVAANFSAQPTNPLDMGYHYSSGSDAAAKAYGAGVLMYLQVIPRWQSTLTEHQDFWAAFSAGSYQSQWAAL